MITARSLLACLAFLLANSPVFAEPEPAVGSFRKVVLDTGCRDAMELAVAPDGRVFYAERSGALKVWKPSTGKTVEAGRLAVFGNPAGSKDGGWEDGLVGLRLDPGFAQNNWLYLFYSPKDAVENRVSRFAMNGDTLDLSSEKILLRIPTQRDVCCHTGGSLAFDGSGNLFVSVGDNTNPFESDGFGPFDDRPGRYAFDASRSSANANDLRGKILRVHPEENGTISIPEGNLFPKGTPKTRPEIYIMGCRNPFRISLDSQTSTLYWGEVGPDAQETKPERGPAGFDEFNRASKPGNFGWPFFAGDNKPYRAYDFGSKVPGPAFDPLKPINNSFHNTGPRELPPAQPAWIWYPYSASARFPQLGSGGRTACAGPVYHFDAGLKSPGKLPAQLDNTLFLFEWTRNWIKTVRLDGKEASPRIEAFAPNLAFKRPMDLDIGPDGCLYVIEWGTNWEGNKDGQIIRLEYSAAP